MMRRLVVWALVLSVLLVGVAGANTRLGLHVTSDELAIWKQRAVSGPYRVSGDVRTNSPGDWTKISNNGLSTPSAMAANRFIGQTATSCVTSGTNLNNPFGVSGNLLRDAAFYYLVTGNLTVRGNAVTELLAQVNEPGANFADRTRWCVIATNHDNFFSTAMTVSKIIYAYDYILAGDQVWGQSLSAGNKTTIEQWIVDAGEYFEALNHTTIALYVLDRKADTSFNANYALTGTGSSRCTTDYHLAYFNGPIIKIHPATWNNRQGMMAVPYALAGILLDGGVFEARAETLKTEAKRFFTEFIRFGLFADGMSNDFTKSGEGNFTSPNAALVYGLTTYGTLAQIADVFARAGDTSLYEYTTSVGNCGTAGGTKNFLLFATDMAKYVDHTFLRHGTNNATNAQSTDWLIDTNAEIGPNNTVVDHALAISNLWYENTYLNTVYRRTVAGQNGYTVPGYPTNPSGSYYQWGGAWGVMPGVLFQAGQLEGVVDPYTLGTPSGGPIAWWKLDEAVGSPTAADSSGNGRTATLTNGPVFQPTGGQVGGALQFDGVNDYAAVADFAPPTSITMMAWIFPTGVLSNTPGLILGKAGSEYDLRLDSAAAGAPALLSGTAGGINLQATGPNFNTLLNTWHHVAYTFDAATDTHVLYHNGLPVANGTNTGTITDTTFPLWLGRNSQFNFGTFPGRLDDVRIYPRALTADEVNTIANPSSVTEFFPLFCCKLPGCETASNWSEVTNSYASLGIRILNPDLSVNMGDSTVVRLPHGSMNPVPGRMVADVVDKNQKTTLAVGDVTDIEYRIEIDPATPPETQFQCKPHRQSGAALDQYANIQTITVKEALKALAIRGGKRSGVKN